MPSVFLLKMAGKYDNCLAMLPRMSWFTAAGRLFRKSGTPETPSKADPGKLDSSHGGGPKTGDESKPTIYMVTMGGAVISSMITALLLRRRKE